MKKVLIIFMISSPLFSLCQTKKETQEWIANKLEIFAFSDHTDLNVFYKILFDSCNMWITAKKEILSSGGATVLNQRTKIPIKNIIGIKFSEQSNLIWFTIKTNDDVIEEELIDINLYTKESEFIFYIDKQIKNENLEDRLKKAFNNLISMCGGLVTKEVY